MSDLGNYIKEKRIQAGLSYKELSIMTGISDTSLQRMEDRNAKMGESMFNCKGSGISSF